MSGMVSGEMSSTNMCEMFASNGFTAVAMISLQVFFSVYIYIVRMNIKESLIKKDQSKSGEEGSQSARPTKTDRVALVDIISIFLVMNVYRYRISIYIYMPWLCAGTCFLFPAYLQNGARVDVSCSVLRFPMIC